MSVRRAAGVGAAVAAGLTTMFGCTHPSSPPTPPTPAPTAPVGTVTTSSGMARITGSASADGGPPGSTTHVTGVVLRREDGRQYVVQPLSANGRFSRDVLAGRYTVTAVNIPQCSTSADVGADSSVPVTLECQLK